MMQAISYVILRCIYVSHLVRGGDGVRGGHGVRGGQLVRGGPGVRGGHLVRGGHGVRGGLLDAIHSTSVRPYESCKNIQGPAPPICPFGAGT